MSDIMISYAELIISKLATPDVHSKDLNFLKKCTLVKARIKIKAIILDWRLKIDKKYLRSEL